MFTSVKHHVHNGFFRQLMVKAQELEKTHLIHGFINIYGFFNFRVFFFTFSLSVKEKLFDVSLDFSNTAGLQSK